MDKGETTATGKRLRAFREKLQIPRSRFAVSIGYGSERIASYESGRAPLPYAVFIAIAKRYALDPFWLATGYGKDCEIVFSYPSATELGMPENASFIDFFSHHLKPSLSSPDRPGMLKTISRRQLIITIQEHIERVLQLIPDGFLNQFDEQLRKFLTDFYLNLPIEDPKTKFQRRLNFAKAEAIAPLRHLAETRAALIKKLFAQVKQTHLTEPETYEKVGGDVKKQLPSLLERLKRATKETGKMSALAAHLKVPLASVSRWLAGSREPGGEVALQMLKWVEHQERQK